MPPYHDHRLVPLEAYRGIAACIVLVHHFFLGFSPLTTGLLPQVRDADSLIGAPYFFLFNGLGAVYFFFTLSGFVLGWSYFRRGDPAILLRAFVKRLPRLAGIVTLITVSSWALFATGLYVFTPAAELSGSPWLASFAGAGTPPFEVGFVDALLQGLTTFFTGQATYNTNLWTMRPEFMGSLLVYLLAAFIAVVLAFRHLLAAGTLLAIAALYQDALLFPFVIGVFCAARLARRPPVWPLPVALAVIVLGLYLLGYMIPEQSYRWVAWLPQGPADRMQTLLFTAGAICLIVATMASRPLYALLDRAPFRLLGLLSFPLYLVHIPVICSLSSALYLWLHAQGVGGTAQLVAVFAVTVLATVGLSLPLLRFDRWWVALVDAGARRLLGQPERGPDAPPEAATPAEATTPAPR
jgi:peptidoglycan/LPS O-acetylase OafA/YrhL